MAERVRWGSLQDLVEATRLLDALPNVDVVIPVLGAQDVPPELMTIASVDVMLRNTSKPVGLAVAEKPEDVRYLVAMAGLLRRRKGVSRPADDRDRWSRR